MEAGMWTSYFADVGPEEALELFAGRGWHCVELSTEHAATLLERGDPSVVGERFAGFAADLGVRIPQGHLKLGADITHADPTERRRELDELKRWMDLFAAIGIEAGVLHPGGVRCLRPYRLSPEVLEENVASLSELVEHANGRLPVICLENGGSAHELLRLIHGAGGKGLGICFDTGHLSVVRAQAPEMSQSESDFIREAGDYLKALHIADNDGSSDQHLLPFEGGAVDWDSVMEGLREVGYAGLFNFEIPGETGCPIPERLAKLDSASEIARRLLKTSEREDD